ncbi:MAG TPA: S41 family peptidase [Patescibacteria group bacterium]|nr:S41 family peptidase [Patescibacteria group bacterium]
MKSTNFKNLIVVAVLMIFCLALGYGIGAKGFEVNYVKGGNVTISRVTPEPNVDFSLFWKVWDDINSTYYDKSKIIPSQMVYGAIQGMVNSLGDPYTMFLPPSENQVTNQDLQGNFSGVGIELGYKGQNLAVEAPLPGSPAEKAGVKPGDLIVGIKDAAKNVNITNTQNITLGQAVEDIRGNTGTKVTLTLVRDGTSQPITVDIIRENINVPSVTLEYVGDNKDIAHISILKFGADTYTEWQKEVADIQTHQNIKGVILDLRNNPGGYLQDAVDIAGEFLPEGSTVVIQQDGNGNKEPLLTNREGAFVNTKTVVLINGGSASASEILSGALRDDRKIQLVGEKSFGKGTVQEPLDLDGGAGIHITVAKWLTPNGTWVHGVGLTPDVKVTQSATSTSDDQLNAAVKLFQ